MSTNGYISVPVTTDSQTLVQTALTSLSSSMPGWVPREGNMEVLLLEEFAGMVAEAATVASDVPDTIFRYFGSLVGITPLTGTAAEITAQFSLVNNAPTGGYIIPSGTVAGFYYQGTSYQFQTEADVTISAGSKTASNVKMKAVDVGQSYNIWLFPGFNASSQYMQMLVPDTNVASILIQATHGSDSTLALGVDAESDSDYQNRLAAELQLLAPRPITTSDYAALASNVSGVYRSFATDGFNPDTNLYTVNDAFLSAATTVANWTPVGNGTNTPTLAVSSAGLTMTAANVATGTTTYLTTAAAAGDKTLVVNTAIIGTGVSASAPAFVILTDATNGNELVAVTAVGGTGNKTWTLAAPLTYAHSTGAGSTNIAPLQGFKTPNLPSLYSNQNYYQTVATLKAGTDATGGTSPANPYTVAIATYADGTTALFSSIDWSNSTNFSYTDASKIVSCNIKSIDPTATNYVAPLNAGPNSSVWQTLAPPITAIQNYVLFYNATSTKTHILTYMACNMVMDDFAGNENTTSTTNDYNWLADSNADSYAYTNGSGASWTADSGITVLPGFGFQYVGTGSALGSDKFVKSQVIPLASKYVGRYVATVRVDCSSAGSTYNDIVLQVWDKTANTVLSSNAGSVTTPTSASSQILTFDFTIANPKDVYIAVKFATGLNVPINQSVLISDAALYYNYNGLVTASVLANTEIEPGYTWTPGGNFIPNAFVASRSVALAPVDSRGVYVGSALADTLYDYLESYREINFSVRICTPNYVPINVTWSAVSMPGYTTADVASRVNASIYSFLDPSNWAGGGSTPPYWDRSQKTVRVLDIGGIIASTLGVANVTSVLIGQSTPGDGATLSSADVIMSGIAPLPVANAVIGSVTASSSSSLGGL